MPNYIVWYECLMRKCLWRKENEHEKKNMKRILLYCDAVVNAIYVSIKWKDIQIRFQSVLVMLSNLYHSVAMQLPWNVFVLLLTYSFSITWIHCECISWSSLPISLHINAPFMKIIIDLMPLHYRIYSVQCKCNYTKNGWLWMLQFNAYK